MKADTALRGESTFIGVARAANHVDLATCAHGVAIDLTGVKALLDSQLTQQLESGTVYSSVVG